MTERRLRQSNLFGPAGFVSADDGEVIELSQQGFEQKPGHRTQRRARRPRRRRQRPPGHRDAHPRHVPLLARRDGAVRVEIFRVPRARPALRRLRERGRLGELGSVARVLRRRLQLPPRAAREPRARLPARHARLRDARACCAIASTASARRSSTTRTTSAMVVGAPLVRAHSAERIECEANYAVFRTKLNELSTVFNVGRTLDVVVPTSAGLKFKSRVVVYDSRDDPELDHLPVVMAPGRRPDGHGDLIHLNMPVITSPARHRPSYKFTMWQAMLHRHPAVLGRVHLRVPERDAAPVGHRPAAARAEPRASTRSAR